jgi:O-antigen/teichoic acid export membrane protein
MSASAKTLPSGQARSILSFFGGNLGTTVLSLFASLLVTRWSEPRQLGMWNFALLLATYASVLQLGVFNGLNRQIPYYLGKNDG